MLSNLSTPKEGVIFDIIEKMTKPLGPKMSYNPLNILQKVMPSENTEEIGNLNLKEYNRISTLYSENNKRIELSSSELAEILNKNDDSANIESVMKEMTSYDLPPLLNPLPKDISEEYEIHTANTDKINEVINNLKDIIPKFLKELPFSKLPYEIHEKIEEIIINSNEEEEENNDSEDRILIRSIMEEESKEYDKMIIEIINRIKSSLNQLNKQMSNYCDELKKEYIENYSNKRYKLLDNSECKTKMLNIKFKSINELLNENSSGNNSKMEEMNNIIFDKHINEIIKKNTLSPINRNLSNLNINNDKVDNNNSVVISLNVFQSLFLNKENDALYTIGYNKNTHQTIYENMIINKFKNPQSFYQFYYQNLIFNSLLENNEKILLNFTANKKENFSIVSPKIVINNKYIIPIVKVHFVPYTYEEEYNDSEIELYTFLDEIDKDKIDVRFIHISYDGKIRSEIDRNIEESNLKHEKQNLINNIQYFKNIKESESKNHFVCYYNGNYVSLTQIKDDDKSNFTLSKEFIIENDYNSYPLKYKKNNKSVHTFPYIKIPYCLNYLQFQDCPLKNICPKIHLYPLVDIGYYLCTKYKKVNGKIEQESVSLDCKSFNICSDFLNGCCKSSYGSLKCKNKHCSQSEALKLMSNCIKS